MTTNQFTRRNFCRLTGVAAGTAALHNGTTLTSLAAASNTGGLPQRVLGRTKLNVSIMTLGTAPLGMGKDVSAAEGAQLINQAIDLGINFIDTAEQYAKAEKVIGNALGARRKDITLATKVMADSVAAAEKSFSGSLRDLKTASVDVLYWHHLGDRKVEGARAPEGVFTWLLKQKQAGKCRFIGVSGHNGVARYAPFIENGDVDVLLVVLNYVDRNTYNFEERVLPAARKQNLGIVAMKVLGGAGAGGYSTRKSGAKIGPENIETAMRYALSLEGVTTVNIGMHTSAQLQQNVEIIKRFKPISDQEMARIITQGKKVAGEWKEHFGPA